MPKNPEDFPLISAEDLKIETALQEQSKKPEKAEQKEAQKAEYARQAEEMINALETLIGPSINETTPMSTLDSSEKEISKEFSELFNILVQQNPGAALALKRAADRVFSKIDSAKRKQLRKEIGI